MLLFETYIIIHGNESEFTSEAILETKMLEQYVHGKTIFFGTYNCDKNISPFYR